MPPKWSPDFRGLLVNPQDAWQLEQQYNLHFDTHLKPIFENAVEVFGEKEHGIFSIHRLNKENPYSSFYNTHKALLINIEPIKEESAEDILREMISELDGPTTMIRLNELIKKAKAYLQKKGK